MRKLSICNGVRRMKDVWTKRINELAKKAKTVGLTEAEKEEQTLLRQEFLIKFRANFKTQLDNIEIVDEDEKEEK